MFDYIKSHPIVGVGLAVIALIVGVGFITRKNNKNNPATTQDASTTQAGATSSTPFVGAPGPQFVNVTTAPVNVTTGAGSGGPNPPPPPTIISVAWNRTYHPSDNESIDNLGVRITQDIQAVYHQYNQAYTGNTITKAEIIAHNPWLATGGYIKNTPNDNLHVGARTLILPQALAVNTAKRGGGVAHASSGGSHPIGVSGGTGAHGGRAPYGRRSGVVGPGSHRGGPLHFFHSGGGVVGPGGVVGGEKTGVEAGSQLTGAGAIHMGLNHHGDFSYATAPPNLDTPQPPKLGASDWAGMHIVGHGDTIENIGIQYNTPWHEIYNKNRHTIDNVSTAHGHQDLHYRNLYEGTVLQVPS